MAAGFRRALCKESFWAIGHTGTARDGFAPIRQMRSVLILGAGPAGSAAALALARAGRSQVVIAAVTVVGVVVFGVLQALIVAVALALRRG